MGLSFNHCCHYGNTTVVKYLIEHGADVNIVIKDVTPLSRIYESYRIKYSKEIKKLLFKNNLNISLKMKDETSLMISYEHINDIILKILEKYSDEVNKNYLLAEACKNNINAIVNHFFFSKKNNKD